MTLRKYYDEVRAKVTNVLQTLQFNGVDVLTSLKTDGRSLPIKNVADPVDDQDAVTKKYLADNGSGGVASVNEVSPSSGDVTVTLDSVAKKGAVSSVAVSVPDDAYAAGWAASDQVPTKNALYAKIELMATKEYVDGKISGTVPITLPAASTVEGRIAAAVEGVDYPTGWVLTHDDKNLDITHNLGSGVNNITVFNFADATTRQIRLGAAAFTGFYDYDGDAIKIQSLANINARIQINLFFE